MPEARLARARGTLPPGFQFGDGRLPMRLMWRLHEWRLLGALRSPMGCRVLNEDAALDHWNTIEAED